MLMGAITAPQAASYHLGALAEGYNDFGPHAVLAGSFLDRIYFTLPANGGGDFGAGPLNFSLRGVPYREIGNMSMSLFGSSNAHLGGGLDFFVNPLGAGNYYLQVTGDATGTAGGLYAGSINMTSLPIPEPGIWSSLLAGLAIIGLMAFRRGGTA